MIGVPAGGAIQLEEVQGNILRGYRMRHAGYLFVTVEDAARGRALLAELLPHVVFERDGTWRSDERPELALNVAVTCPGLEALGVPPDVVASFPEEFREGMARRADRLGDVGGSHPEQWEAGLGDGRAHLGLIVHAHDPGVRSRRLGELRKRVEADGGLAVAHEQSADLGADAREHFGFTDGFSQPAVEGAPATTWPGERVPRRLSRWERPLKAGEFVLGYADEDGWPASPLPPFGVNCTFMVYRKLSQDVDAFKRLVRDAAARYTCGDDERLAAEIVGRWRDGAPLVRTPSGPDPDMGNDPAAANAFGYAEDALGQACPLGAHIRRANPRDGLSGGVARTRRHRIIRRGMPYEEQGDGQVADRGLVFICFNASIARQFEVVQSWLLDGNVVGVPGESDFLMGADDGRGTRMTIQGDPPVILVRDRPLVITRGGEYLYVPSRSALRALAEPPPAGQADGAEEEEIPPPPPRPVLPAWRRALKRRVARLLLEPWALAVLRRLRPVLRTGDVWIVTRYDDVVDVLARDREFEVPYGPAMRRITGPFILGMPDGRRYRHERDALWAGLPPGVEQRIAAVSEREARAALDAARGRIDVVGGLTDPAIAAAVEDLFGLPAPSPAQLLDWSRPVFREVFLNPLGDPGVTRRGQAAAQAMGEWLSAEIRRRDEALREGEEPRETMLDRLLRPQANAPSLDLTRARDSLLGLTVAWAVSVSRAFALAVDSLLDTPGALHGAARAAGAGGSQPVTGYLLEALRFEPAAPGLERYCPYGAVIAAGTGREQVVPPGGRVLAATSSAMRDGRNGGPARPRRFSADRPAPANLHFGSGLHRCFGERIAGAQMTALAAVLLSRPGLRRASGRAGRLQERDTYPRSLWVEWDHA